MRRCGAGAGNGRRPHGGWADETTALRTWRDRAGLHDSDESAVIRLAEENDDQEQVLTAWERGRVAGAKPNGGEPTGPTSR
ncbi:hypothetical protein OHB54_06925 [Streptomyces sp. NBC_01007]|nr:hypothetical protein OHB54_06925 [Streptomyces sp. NBC_01007]